MLPIIEAEESLSTITTHAVASGSLKSGESKRIMNKLQKQAGMDNQYNKSTNKGEFNAKAVVLKTMGVDVVDTREKNKS
jgi:predicted nucleic acid-binding Zn ribbon protein|tara:strand:- start:1860 stop:2096 length:237 start_codon:yes stop_codon:yes gene_type:complete